MKLTPNPNQVKATKVLEELMHFRQVSIQRVSIEKEYQIKNKERNKPGFQAIKGSKFGRLRVKNG